AIMHAGETEWEDAIVSLLRHRPLHADRRLFLARASVAGLTAWIPSLRAQSDYPTKTIKLIAPVQPGGGVDLVARTIADRLGRSLGQSIVVENMSGGGGVVGSLATARAAPD